MTIIARMKKWRGKRTVLECAVALGVPYQTAINWFIRGKPPHPYRQQDIIRRMEANKE